MTFIEAFEKVKAATEKSSTEGIAGHVAIQVNLCDEDASGIMYIEVADGVLSVEPYDYVDRDAMITVSSKDLVRVLSGRLGYDKAVANGVLAVAGNEEKAAELKKLVVKAERKSCAKKAGTAEKAPTKKTTKKAAKA